MAQSALTGLASQHCCIRIQFLTHELCGMHIIQSSVIAIKMQTVAMQDVTYWPAGIQCGQSPTICITSSPSCIWGLLQTLGLLSSVEHLFDVKEAFYFYLLTKFT